MRQGGRWRDPDLSRDIDRHAVRALGSVAGRRAIVDAMLPSAAVSRRAARRRRPIGMAGRPALPVSAAQDPGVASELLATSTSLGGLSFTDNTHPDVETLAVALGSAGDWRYSGRWLLDAWDSSMDVGTLATARAAIAGWAGEGRSGLIVYVYGGALHGTEGLIGVPGPLHSYLLCVSRSADGSDTVDSVWRMILSCPGEHWCHRRGCPIAEFPEADALLASIVTMGEVAGMADQDDGWAGETYQQMYSTRGVDDYSEGVLDCLEAELSGASWVELERSTWEGGMEQSLLRRGEHCLAAFYPPAPAGRWQAPSRRHTRSAER